MHCSHVVCYHSAHALAVTELNGRRKQRYCYP